MITSFGSYAIGGAGTTGMRMKATSA
jgi:hypothetical protein